MNGTFIEQVNHMALQLHQAVPFLFHVLLVIALLALASLALGFLGSVWRILYPFLIARPKNLEKLAGKGSWAVVTGCTDGIGRAYAEELAGKGFSLVLVSRTQQKLAIMEAEFRRRFPKCNFIILPFDFSENSMEEYNRRLLEPITRLDIGILVNNVGAMHSYPQRFHDSEGGLEKMAQIMTINMLPVTVLSAFVLEQMARRNKGIIVNISSIMGYDPYYYGAIYSATKAYVTFLSSSMRQEYANYKGIVIQTICPGVVITNMSSFFSDGKKGSLFVPDAKQFARSAVRTIGVMAETCGCMGHQIQHEMTESMPQSVRNWVAKMVMLKARKDYLKKIQGDGNGVRKI